MAALGDGRHLVADVVPGLAEETDRAPVRKTAAGRRVAAEPSMFRHQRVGTVTQLACRITNTRVPIRSFNSGSQGTLGNVQDLNPSSVFICFLMTGKVNNNKEDQHSRGDCSRM